MDDKRTLLAFLLIGLIFILSPYYYEWMGMTPKPEGPAREEQEHTENNDRVYEQIEKPIEIAEQQEQTQQKWESSEVENVQKEPLTSSPTPYTPKNVYIETPLLSLIHI